MLAENEPADDEVDGGSVTVVVAKKFEQEALGDWAWVDTYVAYNNDPLYGSKSHSGNKLIDLF